MNQSENQGIKAGMPPESAVYIGSAPYTETKIRHIRYNKEQIDDNYISGITNFEQSDGFNHLLFVEGLHDTATIEEVCGALGISNLVAEDILNTHHITKVEDYSEYLFISIKDLHFEKKKNKLYPTHFSLIFKKHLLVCFSESHSAIFEPVILRLSQVAGKLRNRDADYLLYEMLDIIIDRYIVAGELLNNVTSTLEEKAYANPGNDYLMKLQINRKNINLAYLLLVPTTEQIFKLKKTENDLIPRASFRYIDDLLDHLRHSVQLFELLREMNSGIRESYSTEVNLKMNRIMKLLTLVSTIFIPLSFFTGVYGMNFDYMPELSKPYGYFVFWAAMLLIVAALLLLFKRKKWL